MALLAMTHLRNLTSLITTALEFEPGTSAGLSSLPLLLLSTQWDFHYKEYLLEPIIRKLIEDIVFVVHFVAALLREITISAFCLLEHSVCNPGARMIRMDQEEFLERFSHTSHIEPRHSWTPCCMVGVPSVPRTQRADNSFTSKDFHSEFVIFEDNDKFLSSSSSEGPSRKHIMQTIKLWGNDADAGN
ncbi:hypothetical protein K438DRAFT_1783270 [Mycena galopus ATCC 62051]|nr:hypothetical protein K438DRAFT_1783270 [Mycena galopus ATCC 62051]